MRKELLYWLGKSLLQQVHSLKLVSEAIHLGHINGLFCRECRIRINALLPVMRRVESLGTEASCPPTVANRSANAAALAGKRVDCNELGVIKI